MKIYPRKGKNHLRAYQLCQKFVYLIFLYTTVFMVHQRSLGSAITSAGARLSELDLSDNAFGPDGVKGIEQLLMSPSCHSLKVLRLNNCGMGIGGGKVSRRARASAPHSRASTCGLLPCFM